MAWSHAGNYHMNSFYLENDCTWEEYYFATLLHIYSSFNAYLLNKQIRVDLIFSHAKY